MRKFQRKRNDRLPRCMMVGLSKGNPIKDTKLIKILIDEGKR